VTVDRFQQLFLLARNHGKKEPSEWAHYAWKTLDAQNLKIEKEGKLLETAEENVAELTSRASNLSD
jgi:hypothetical protein